MSDQLAAALEELLGGTVENLQRLSGGASRETWAFDVVDDGKRQELVVLRDRAGSASAAIAREAALLRAAAAAGVPVPEIVETSDEPRLAGAAFMVTKRLVGETIPRRILRDDAYAGARGRLASQCGQVLARLHSIPPDAVAGLDHADQLDRYRSIFGGLNQPSAAFELAFRWLARRRPTRTGESLVHGDFRNGNLMVDAAGLVAVLDWELAHAGDPMEDLAWLCVKSWRFGSSLPVGGFGTYDDLIAAYEKETGVAIDRDALRWWEVLGNLKWGIMCILQTMAHVSGRTKSVELAAIGRRVCEVEWDLMRMLEGEHV